MQLLTVEPTPQERYSHALNLLRSAKHRRARSLLRPVEVPERDAPDRPGRELAFFTSRATR
jgi:hypothetical protein